MLVCLSMCNATCAIDLFQSVCFLKSPEIKSTGERLGEFCGGEQVAETYTSRSGGCFSTLLPSDHFTSDHFPKGNTRTKHFLRNTEMQFENTRNTNTGSRDLHVSQWWLPLLLPMIFRIGTFKLALYLLVCCEFAQWQLNSAEEVPVDLGKPRLARLLAVAATLRS